MERQYKHIDLSGNRIAYRVQGSGRPMLLVHGFASSSLTWEPFLCRLPKQFEFHLIDLKGFGFSDKRCDDHLSPFDQAKLIVEYVRRFDLRDVILVGHSMGGAASVIALSESDIRRRVSHLALFDSAGFFQTLPGFIEELIHLDSQDPILKYVNEDVIARIVLNEVYYDPAKITDELVRRHGKLLRLEGAKECMVAAAKQLGIPNSKQFHRRLSEIDVPTLVVWGEDDEVIDVEDAFHFRDDIPNAILEIIPSCGHSPHEELPERTASIFLDFLGVTAGNASAGTSSLSQGPPPKDAPPLPLHQKSPVEKLRMRNLIDNWNLGTVGVIMAIKFFQILKKIGIQAKEDGWRKASSVFFRSEHAKFCLGCFRLDYRSNDKTQQIDHQEEAENLLVARLAEFIRDNPACHWKIHSHRFRVRRKRVDYVDVIAADFAPDGELRNLKPHFDTRRQEFPQLSSSLKENIIKEIIDAYNRFRGMADMKRHRALTYHLRGKFFRKLSPISQFNFELEEFVERVLSGTYVHFEVLPAHGEALEVARLATPHFEKRKHAGAGLINACCRFSHDFAEADLWMQYHHGPVDGTPMQQTLTALRKNWGVMEPMRFPAVGSKAMEPEISHFGDGVFRGRVFLDFSDLLNVRRDLNRDHYMDMGGTASVPSMLIWGLAHSKPFRKLKFVIPVDSSSLTDLDLENQLKMMVIRPGNFITSDKKNDFFRFQRFFQQLLFKARLGKCEVGEFMDLVALNHSLFFAVVRRLFPKTLGEVVGTVCLSIIKEAEMFVAPISALQIEGFIAIGSCKIPTTDHRQVAAISVCGNKSQVESYIKALSDVTNDFQSFL